MAEKGTVADGPADAGPGGAIPRPANAPPEWDSMTRQDQLDWIQDEAASVRDGS